MPGTGHILHKRYRILKEIGRGGSSVVYLCEDINMGKLWACKEISAVAALDGSFPDIPGGGDIRLLKKLDHPMFPRITDAFYEADNYYMISDYIDGISLDTLIKLKGRIPERRALDIGISLMSALMYLHGLSPPILYLDMKPGNVIIRPDGEVRLIDFGIARQILEGSPCMGTVGFSPPEQYGGNTGVKETSKGSDIFAFGMTLAAMVTGTRPSKNLDEQTRFISENRSVSGGLRHIILACTKADINERISDHCLYSRLKRLRGKNKRLAVSLALTAAMVLTLFLSFMSIGRREDRDREALRSMLKSINCHIQDGEYTAEGIRIICSYIDGGFLDDDATESFSYEAARFFIESEGDFVRAKRYLRKLDEYTYPEASYMLRLCEYMTSFDEPDDELIDCLKDFEAYNARLADIERKTKNEKTIALIRAQISEE